MDDEIKTSREGEILGQAMELHRKHLETHDCRDCICSYETLIKAMTSWISRTALTTDALKEISKAIGDARNALAIF